MKRRDFLTLLSMTPLALRYGLQRSAMAADQSDYRNLLVLLELKGGNDGLNTVIPYSDNRYYEFRPRLAIPRDQIIQLDEKTGLHPSLQSLLPLWQKGELAIIQGVGYPNPNLSHFRSIEIWDTASASNEYLETGWLARLFAVHPAPEKFIANGLILGEAELGPLTGMATRAIVINNPDQFKRQARKTDIVPQTASNPALAHILKVENDIYQAAKNLNVEYQLKTEFPVSPLANVMKSAARIVAGNQGPAMIKVSLGSFDTHVNQLASHSALLQQMANALAAFKTALVEIGRWDSTLLLTYSEFGRRPHENMSNGTDHGTANVHFLLGGKVKGGLYGKAPQFDQLQNDNLVYGVDFRNLYATVIEKWWRFNTGETLPTAFKPLEALLKA